MARYAYKGDKHQVKRDEHKDKGGGNAKLGKRNGRISDMA